MKRFILALAAIFFAMGANAQQSYRPFSTFNGDVQDYLITNFVNNKSRYIGKSLENLMQDYELEYKAVSADPYEATIVEGLILSPQGRHSFDIYLKITFQTPLVFDVNPDIQEVRWAGDLLEPDGWIIAMKMKHGIIKDIEFVDQTPPDRLLPVEQRTYYVLRGSLVYALQDLDKDGFYYKPFSDDLISNSSDLVRMYVIQSLTKKFRIVLKSFDYDLDKLYFVRHITERDMEKMGSLTETESYKFKESFSVNDILNNMSKEDVRKWVNEMSHKNVRFFIYNPRPNGSKYQEIRTIEFEDMQ